MSKRVKANRVLSIKCIIIYCNPSKACKKGEGSGIFWQRINDFRQGRHTKKSQSNDALCLKDMVGIQGNKIIFACKCLSFWPFFLCQIGSWSFAKLMPLLYNQMSPTLCVLCITPLHPYASACRQGFSEILNAIILRISQGL